MKYFSARKEWISDTNFENIIANKKLVLNKKTGPKWDHSAKPHVIKPLKKQISLYLNKAVKKERKKEKRT